MYFFFLPLCFGGQSTNPCFSALSISQLLTKYLSYFSMAAIEEIIDLGLPVSEGAPVTITAGGMAAGWQVWCWSSKQELVCVLRHNHGAERVKWGLPETLKAAPSDKQHLLIFPKQLQQLFKPMCLERGRGHSRSTTQTNLTTRMGKSGCSRINTF